MNKVFRFIVSSAIILLVLIFSAFHPLTAYADDATPPPPDTIPTDTPSASTDPIATDPATVDTVTTEVPATDSVPPNPTATDIASTESVFTADATQIDSSTATTLPDGTDVVVLDANGNSVPLTTQQAADIIQNGDPMWCPVGVTIANPTDCVNATTVANLIPLLATKSGPGVVYFTASYGGGGVFFNGSSPNLAALTDLTLQGGWDGNTAGAINYSGTSYFSAPINVINWNGDVTINDLTVENVDGTGLTVTTTGDIHVRNLTSLLNHGVGGNGAYLYNAGGDGSVTLDGTNVFFQNEGAGLRVNSRGDITLNNVFSQQNMGLGAVIDNAYSGASGDVTLTGTNVFSQNSVVELSVDSNGNIELNNVTVLGSGGVGADLSNDHVGSTGNITIYGTNYFVGNIGDGLRLRTLNDATINCATIQNNGGYGVNANAAMLVLNDDAFASNGSGDYTNSGSVSVTSGAPCTPTATPTPDLGENGATSGDDAVIPVTGDLHLVPVAGAEQIDLDCVLYSATELLLPSGDHIIVPCPTSGKASLATLTRDNLPAAIEDGLSFLSGMDAEVTTPLSGPMIVDFTIPADKQDSDLAILRWNGSKWVDLGGAKTSDGFFEVASNLIGDYVLVAK